MNTYTTPIKCNDFTAPVSPSTGLISKLISAVGRRVESHVQRLQEYRQNRINRLAFRTVLNLDDHMLRDIGLTRHDVLWANKLPLSQNASVELNKISQKQRQT